MASVFIGLGLKSLGTMYVFRSVLAFLIAFVLFLVQFASPGMLSIRERTHFFRYVNIVICKKMGFLQHAFQSRSRTIVGELM